MRLGIFSDVHGNLEALQSFEKALKNEQLDRLFCLGDSIGYGPNPNECLDSLRSFKNLVVLKGNHEWAVQNIKEARFTMNSMAYKAIVWTMERLTSENLGYIGNLPLSDEFEQCCFFHASAFRPEDWRYVRPGDFRSIRLCMESAPQRLVFLGHTHCPTLLDINCGTVLSSSVFSDGITYKDSGFSTLIVNPGSIGQPRDVVRSPCYVIYDTGAATLTWRRVSGYDPSLTAKKILSTSLPSELAYFLAGEFR